MVNENIHRFLAALRNVKSCGDNQWTAYCPHHEGDGDQHSSSLSVRLSDDGRILVNCHASCDPRDIVYSAGLTWQDMFPPKRNEPASKITAVYDYEELLDGHRVTRFQVCRLEPDRSGKPGTKDFRQRQPDGKGGHTWKTKGVTKIPYRLPELELANHEYPVFVVEGEKQVDYLRSLGLVATCNPGGAGKWLKSFSKHFVDRDVVVIPDCDPPNDKTGLIVGADHAKTVADSLLEVARSVHVVELPDCRPKWGLDDWLQKGGRTLDDLKTVLEASEPWSPESHITTRVESQEPPEGADPLEYDRRILEEIGITYVAQIEDTSEVEIFSATTQKFSRIRDPSKLAYEQLILHTGSIARLKVRRTADEGKQFAMSEVRAAIASIAAVTPAIDDKFGIGVWEDSGSLVVVNSRELGILNGRPEIQITQEPVYLGRAYNIGDRTNWVNLERLGADMASSGGRLNPLHRDQIIACRDLIAQWEFTEGERSPELLTGLIMATFLQTTWTWRPQVFLIGQSYAGKSTMLRMIANIMGPIAHVSSGSSAAGVRQDIESSGIAVLCDEVEKSRHRKDIMEMVRACGRGDEMHRGSASLTGVRRYKLQHIFWCASTESGLKDEVDQSRFLVFEIQKTNTRPDIPHIDVLRDIGASMLSASIAARGESLRLMEHLLGNKPDSVHGRVCESYALPCAIWGATTGMDDAKCLESYLSAMQEMRAGEQVDNEADTLLQEILMSSILVEGGKKLSVYSMILRRNFEDRSQELANCGIHVFGDRVFLNRSLLSRYLLSKDWIGKRLDQLLIRIDGANREKKRFGSTRLRYISIPLSYISDIQFGDENQRVMSFEESARFDGNPFSSER